jgi:hypothetical protein
MEQHLNHLEYAVKTKTELVLVHHAITSQSGHGGKTFTYSEIYHLMISGERSDLRRLSPGKDPDNKGKCKVMCFIKHDTMKVGWRLEV